MKKLLTLLLMTTIPFSCLAFNKTEYAKAEVNKIFSATSKEVTNYHKNKSCPKAIQIMKKGFKGFVVDRETAVGFVNGISEDDLDCFKKQSKETLKELRRTVGSALWVTHGDGGGNQKTISLFLDNSKNLKEDYFTTKAEGLALLSGYYYATGDKRVFNSMKSVILSAKEKEWCYPKEKPVVDGSECPSEGSLERNQEMLARVEERLKKDTDEGDINLRKALLKDIKNAKSERCIRAWKYSHCLDFDTLYFAAEFLKRYDAAWYNQNVKNWLAEKEKIFLEWDRKEAEESAKRAAENERKRAERKKADDELRKMGVDLDGDPNKVGIIMYNPKTGKTQKLN